MHVIAYVYGRVGCAVTFHSGSATGTCRYMVSLEHLPEPIGGPGSWQWQVFSLKSTDLSHSHGPAKTGDCTHLPDLPSQIAISLYICIILCKGYSAFLIRVFHSLCKSALQCMRFFASEANCKLPLPWTCGHGKGVQIS